MIRKTKNVNGLRPDKDQVAPQRALREKTTLEPNLKSLRHGSNMVGSACNCI